MQSGDVKSCTHCVSVGFYVSFVAGASKVCHSRRLEFEPRPPLAVFVLHLAEFDPGADLPSRSRCTWPSLAGRRKALWSPENSSKEKSEPKGKSMISAPASFVAPSFLLPACIGLRKSLPFYLSADSVLRSIPSCRHCVLCFCALCFLLFVGVVSFHDAFCPICLCRLPPSIVSCCHHHRLLAANGNGRTKID